MQVSSIRGPWPSHIGHFLISITSTLSRPPIALRFMLLLMTNIHLTIEILQALDMSGPSTPGLTAIQQGGENDRLESSRILAVVLALLWSHSILQRLLKLHDALLICVVISLSMLQLLSYLVLCIVCSVLSCTCPRSYCVLVG